MSKHALADKSIVVIGGTSGLGLSASHGIITRHQGEIVVVSEPGEGTRFEVRLPLCDKNYRFVKKSEAEEEKLSIV